MNIVSFFTGGGFLDMGFELSGFRTVFTNEIDPYFAKFYKEGMSSWSGQKRSITHVGSITDLSKYDILDYIPKNEMFGIIGGPPCQDFSVNGNLKGFSGDRGKMTIQFFNKIDELEPDFFVMENVTGLLKIKSHKEYLLSLLKKISEKYLIDYKTLNALDFGVPQYRERVFLIGLRRDIIDSTKVVINLSGNWFPWPFNTEYADAFKKYSWPKPVAFGSEVIKLANIPSKLCIESCLVPKDALDSIPNAKDFFILKAAEEKLKIQEGETNRPSFKRLHRYKYSPTACYGNNEVHLHPYENRRLSVRESLRIQGVSDKYILEPKCYLSKKFKMIGNGVPVPLSEAISSSLKAYFFNKDVFISKELNGYLV